MLGRMLVLAGLVLLGVPAVAQATQGFQGPDPSPTREGFYDVWDKRFQEPRLWQSRWYGMHEDGSNMWHVFDEWGGEYAASCLIMPADPETGISHVECGVTPVAYANAHPSSWPEPVRVRVAQLANALENGMTEHMPFAPAESQAYSRLAPATGSDGTGC